MKRKQNLLAVIIGIISLGFMGCLNEPDDTYTVEMGTISNATYEKAQATIKTWSEPNYAKIGVLKNYLLENTLSDHDTLRAVPEDEIRDFLQARGFTYYQASAELSAMEQIGNDIVFFNSTKGDNYKVWMYFSKY